MTYPPDWVGWPDESPGFSLSDPMTAPMGTIITLPPHCGDALEAVTDADRAWFEAHPHRAYRLRPLALGEVLPGQAATPGNYMVVIRMGSPLVRFRVSVGRPPAHLRHDTDRVCAELIRRLSDAGFTINGRLLGPALASLRSSTMEVLQQHGVREVQP
jgi:hypothetical protein